MTAARHLVLGLACALAAAPVLAQSTPAGATPATRSGREIYERFRAGLADPHCDGTDSRRWRAHFAAAPVRLIAHDDNVLPLFGYVVDALRAASLPTEYALIPFVESGYKPGARSAGGPAGLWQMIAVTARNHAVPMRAGYDGRLSPVDSTRAAVRYLKTLHGMFAGDWRLAVMAYNAGEYRVFGALRKSGQVARSADPEKLTSLSGISRAYVRKLHALSCLFDKADDDSDWVEALDRQVPILQAVPLPSDARDLGQWAARNGLDRAAVQRMNPALAEGRIVPGPWRPEILAPVATDLARAAPDDAPPTSGASVPAASPAPSVVPSSPVATSASPRHTHRVRHGDSLQRIAHRYKVRVADLLTLNDLTPKSVLQPGMLLKLDAAVPR